MITKKDVRNECIKFINSIMEDYDFVGKYYYRRYPSYTKEDYTITYWNGYLQLTFITKGKIRGWSDSKMYYIVNFESLKDAFSNLRMQIKNEIIKDIIE